MMANNDDYEDYVKDSRIPCRYGVKCYQKNTMHHEKYKHPPKIEQTKLGEKHVNKKRRVELPKKCNEKPTDHQSSETSASSDNSTDSNDETCKVGTEEFVSETSESDNNSDCSEHENFKNISESKESSSGLKDIKTFSETSNNMSDSDVSGNNTQNNRNEESVNVGSVISNSTDLNVFIRSHFLVYMPNDFYQFWDFCKKLKSTNALEALKDVGLTLVGPYDVLAGKFDNIQVSEEEYLIHWRYFRDPPEFQTVLKGEDRTGYHIGYFRDSPDDLPVFLASNHEKRDGTFVQIGGNIFSAVNLYLEDLKKIGDPFKKMHIGRIQSLLTNESNVLNIDLLRKTEEMVAREKKIVTRTLNKIGLVVPFDKKTEQGYRELAVDNRELKSLFSKLQNSKPEEKSKYLSELQPVFTFANIAADECDFGTGIELGWNIIAHGVDSLNDTAARFLSTNYRLLNKEAFAKIAIAHMKNRRKGYKLSIL